MRPIPNSILSVVYLGLISWVVYNVVSHGNVSALRFISILLNAATILALNGLGGKRIRIAGLVNGLLFFGLGVSLIGMGAWISLFDHDPAGLSSALIGAPIAVVGGFTARVLYKPMPKNEVQAG